MIALLGHLMRYGVTGIVSVAIYIGLLLVLIHISPLHEAVANAISYGVATLLNYLLNYYWAFSSASPHSQASWRFLAVVAAGFCLNSLYVAMLTSLHAPVEMAAISFAVLWPLISFTSLKLWALR